MAMHPWKHNRRRNCANSFPDMRGTYNSERMNQKDLDSPVRSSLDFNACLNIQETISWFALQSKIPHMVSINSNFGIASS